MIYFPWYGILCIRAVGKTPKLDGGGTEMKKSMMFVTVVFVAMMAFVGCANPVLPTPDPDPVKVYLTGSETFTRVDAAGTLAYADIYQWDGEGTMYTGDDVVVTFDATYITEWTITVSGNVYLNDANLSPAIWAEATDETMDFHLVVVAGVIEIDWIEDAAGDNMSLNFIVHTGHNEVKDVGTGTSVWTR